MQGIQNQLSIYYDLLDDPKKHINYRKSSLANDNDDLVTGQNPCVVKPHTRFGLEGAKSMSMSSASLNGGSKTSVLRKSNRGQSSQSQACKLKLANDKRKSEERLELLLSGSGNELDLLLQSKNVTTYFINSIFFMASVKRMESIMFDDVHLVSPDINTVADLETSIVNQLDRGHLKPHICPFAFVHYTTPRYDPDAKVSSGDTVVNYYDILALLHSEAPVPLYSSSKLLNTLVSDSPIVIGMAISNWHLTPSAGDIFTSKELADSIIAKYNVVVKYLLYDEDWYNAETIDILIVFVDYYELSNVYNRKPGLVQIAWMRNWFQGWLGRPYIGNYDLLLVSSTVAVGVIQNHEHVSELALPVNCAKRCPQSIQELAVTRRVVPVALLRIATNAEMFHPAAGEEQIISVDSFAADYVFTGSYWEVKRDIMQLDPSHPKLKPYRGSIIGRQWHHAVDQGNVSRSWVPLIKGDVPYELLPDIYRATKVVIDDANHVTKPWGSVNSRVFDAVAAGALVITNGKLGSFDAFAGLLPVYNTPLELVSTMEKYLKDKDKREIIVSDLRDIILKHHTYPTRAVELVHHINSLMPIDIIKHKTIGDKSTESDELLSDTLPCICIGIRVYEGQPLEHLKLLLQSLELQRETMDINTRRVDLSYFAINTDKATVEYTLRLEELIASFNGPHSISRTDLFNRGDSISRASPYNTLRGYDEVDRFIKHIVLRKECEWVMVTNGDNSYSAVRFII